MYLERLLQINMATLAALGASLLGMGQDNAWLALGISCAAGASIWVTDINGWFRLHKAVAYTAALAASALCLWRLMPFDYSTVSILIPSVANLLLYLQVILLFQKKDDRIYWQLIMLSLLQVVVATLFSQGAWFGLLLIVYMLVGSSALTLLCLHRLWSDFRSANTAGSEPPIDKKAHAKKPWPSTTEPPRFTSIPGGRESSGIGWELYRRLSKIALWSFAVTLVLFYTVPRSSRRTQTSWRGSVITPPKQVVGFDEQVSLGELGQIIESPEKVMEITLSNMARNQTYQVEGELYLRGAVLMHYNNGQWFNLPPDQDRSRGRAVRNLPVSAWHATNSPWRDLPLTRQSIDIEPLNRPQLFCIWPFFSIRYDQTLKFDDELKQFVREKQFCDVPREVEVSTTALLASDTPGLREGIVWRRQARLSPPDELSCGQTSILRNRSQWLEPYLQLPESPRLKRLEAVAETWINESGMAEADRITQANILTRQFQNDPDRFEYSLEGQPRDETIDPIEDFVSDNRKGHCEYFATALALMLRSRGIPSRVIVGYRCDEVDEYGTYRVRQLHAHTWVEAYLRPEDIQRHRFAPALFEGPADSLWDHGGWYRLEPTLSAYGSHGFGQNTGIMGRIRENLRQIQEFWSRYVVEMDQQRQQDAVYAPVARALRVLLDRLGLSIGVVLSGGALLLGLRLLRRRSALWRQWGRQWGEWWKRLRRKTISGRHSETIEVPFYARLEDLLARHGPWGEGMVRRSGQTQREFATEAGDRLARVADNIADDDRLASLPGCVVEAFYRVRFGRRPLDKTEAETVERALDRLAVCEVPPAST